MKDLPFNDDSEVVSYVEDYRFSDDSDEDSKGIEEGTSYHNSSAFRVSTMTCE